jgi:hypothetical protein
MKYDKDNKQIEIATQLRNKQISIEITVTTLTSCAGFINSIKTVKNELLIFFRNTKTMVCNFNTNLQEVRVVMA